MMQMLAAGGIDPLADDARGPDPHNPRGYYELEAVKRIPRDTAWVPDAVTRVLGEDLDCEAMAAVVDPGLYRRRPGPPG